MSCMQKTKLLEELSISIDLSALQCESQVRSKIHYRTWAIRIKRVVGHVPRILNCLHFSRTSNDKLIFYQPSSSISCVATEIESQLRISHFLFCWRLPVLQPVRSRTLARDASELNRIEPVSSVHSACSQLEISFICYGSDWQPLLRMLTALVGCRSLDWW